MAWVTKYYTRFEDIHERTIQINLQFDGFGGSATRLKSHSIELQWNADSNNIYKPIRASVCTIRLYQDTIDQLDEFLTITQVECRVQFLINSGNYWFGFVLAGNYQRPYNPTPNVVQLMATDGLGMLRGIPYKNSGAIYTGRDTVFNIINKAIRKSGQDLAYLERVNVYEDTMTSTIAYSPLTQTYVDQESLIDQETFVALNCYQVIEKMLTTFGAVLFQEQQRWNIVRIPELFEATRYRLISTAGATTSSGSLDTYNKALSSNDAAKSSFLRFINNNAIVKTTLPRASINFNLPVVNQILLDGSFENASAISDYYTDTNSIGTLQTIDDGTKALRLEFKDNNYYMEYKTTYHGTTGLTGGNNQNFRVKGRCKIDSAAAGTLTWAPVIIIDDGTTEWFAEGELLSWVDFGLNWPLAPSDHGFIDGQWVEYEYQTPEIPVDGGATYEVKIRFFVFTDQTYAYWDDVEIYFQNGILETSEVLDIDADNLYGGDDIDVEMFTRDSDVVNSQLMDKNAMSLSGEVRAYDWQAIQGSEVKQLYKLTQDMYKGQYIRPVLAFQGELRGVLNYNKTIDDGTNRYFPSRVRLKLPEVTMDGEWVHVRVNLKTNLVTSIANDPLGTGNAYDVFSSSANTCTIEKTQVINPAVAGTNTMSITSGIRYRLNANIVENGTSDIPSMTFGGDTKSDLALGSNQWDVISTTTSATHRLIISSQIADTCDLTITITIQEVYGL
jgi:hypothetical protein